MTCLGLQSYRTYCSPMPRCLWQSTGKRGKPSNVRVEWSRGLLEQAPLGCPKHGGISRLRGEDEHAHMFLLGKSTFFFSIGVE